MVWYLTMAMIWLMIGFRHEIGYDWGNYNVRLDLLRNTEFLDVFDANYEFMYLVLNWFAANVFGEIYLVNALCGLAFVYGLSSFCLSQPRPWLALTVAVPYLITVVAMGYTRQSVSIGFAMMALLALTHQRTPAFMAWIAAGALFHRSSIVLMPLALFLSKKNIVLRVLGISTIIFLMFALILQEVFSAFTEVYGSEDLQSQGATFRLALNLIPAVLLISLRKRFFASHNDLTIWLWMAYLSLAFIPWLAFSPSSTAVDRVALYWAPIQILVYARLPDVLSKNQAVRSLIVFMIIVSYFVLFMAWLYLSSYSEAWVPYKFYPLDNHII